MVLNCINTEHTHMSISPRPTHTWVYLPDQHTHEYISQSNTITLPYKNICETHTYTHLTTLWLQTRTHTHIHKHLFYPFCFCFVGSPTWKCPAVLSILFFLKETSIWCRSATPTVFSLMPTHKLRAAILGGWRTHADSAFLVNFPLSGNFWVTLSETCDLWRIPTRWFDLNLHLNLYSDEVNEASKAMTV